MPTHVLFFAPSFSSKAPSHHRWSRFCCAESMPRCHRKLFSTAFHYRPSSYICTSTTIGSASSHSTWCFLSPCPNIAGPPSPSSSPNLAALPSTDLVVGEPPYPPMRVTPRSWPTSSDAHLTLGLFATEAPRRRSSLPSPAISVTLLVLSFSGCPTCPIMITVPLPTSCSPPSSSDVVEPLPLARVGPSAAVAVSPPSLPCRHLP